MPELWRLAPLIVTFYLAQISASKVAQFSYCLRHLCMRFSQIAGLRKSLIQPVKIPNGAQRLDHRLDCCSDAHWFVLRGLVAAAVSKNSYGPSWRGGEAEICVFSHKPLKTIYKGKIKNLKNDLLLKRTSQTYSPKEDKTKTNKQTKRKQQQKHKQKQQQQQQQNEQTTTKTNSKQTNKQTTTTTTNNTRNKTKKQKQTPKQTNKQHYNVCIGN